MEPDISLNGGRKTQLVAAKPNPAVATAFTNTVPEAFVAASVLQAQQPECMRRPVAGQARMHAICIRTIGAAPLCGGPMQH
jgi:hypothetical protein